MPTNRPRSRCLDQRPQAKRHARFYAGRLGWRIRSHRSEEHTSELQSPCNLVCRLLLEKKKNTNCRVFVCFIHLKSLCSDCSVITFEEWGLDLAASKIHYYWVFQALVGYRSLVTLVSM